MSMSRVGLWSEPVNLYLDDLEQQRILAATCDELEQERLLATMYVRWLQITT